MNYVIIFILTIISIINILGYSFGEFNMIKNVSAINFITGEKGFIVDSADKIWRTSDGGKTWSLSYELPTKGTDNYIRYITMINQETAYVLGSTILKTNN